MKNYLDIVAAIIAAIVYSMYAIIGGVCDTICKLAAFIVCIPLLIVAAFALPFISDKGKQYFKRFAPIYKLGGCWKFEGANYPTINYFINQLNKAIKL